MSDIYAIHYHPAGAMVLVQQVKNPAGAHGIQHLDELAQVVELGPEAKTARPELKVGDYIMVAPDSNSMRLPNAPKMLLVAAGYIVGTIEVRTDE